METNHVANRLGAGEQHHQPVDADASPPVEAAHTQRPHMSSHLVRPRRRRVALIKLLGKSLVLSTGSFNSEMGWGGGEGVAQLKAAAEKLKALHMRRSSGLAFEVANFYG